MNTQKKWLVVYRWYRAPRIYATRSFTYFSHVKPTLKAAYDLARREILHNLFHNSMKYQTSFWKIDKSKITVAQTTKTTNVFPANELQAEW